MFNMNALQEQSLTNPTLARVTEGSGPLANTAVAHYLILSFLSLGGMSSSQATPYVFGS